MAEQIQATKEAIKRKVAAEIQRRDEERPGDTSPVTPRSKHQVSEQQLHDSYELLEPDNNPDARNPDARSSSVPRSNPSLFDEDLPELLDTSVSEPAFSLPGIDLEGLAAELGDASPLDRTGTRNRKESADSEEHSYRVSCPNCTTMQYVPLSAQGSMLKCPDCLIKFKVVPPPANWRPSSIHARHKSLNEARPLDREEEIIEIDKRRQQRTEAMLKQAEDELEKEEKEGQTLGTDFDTTGFVRQTFGFLFDPIALGVVLGYGLAFALIFAMIQYGLSAEQGNLGRAAALFFLLTGPLLGILFTLPMVSAALAQLESVANRESRVIDWPGFNVFENLADSLGVASALAAAAIPGFIIASWLAGDGEGSGRIQIAGVMMTTLVLFPIFLLSVLDNGSMLQLISSDVIRSLREVTEAWAGYYLKTLIVFATTMIFWLLLLGEGKPAFLAALAGAMLPALVFFTFQQLGGLAGTIGENLSPIEQDEKTEEPSDVLSEPEETRQNIGRDSDTSR